MIINYFYFIVKNINKIIYNKSYEICHPGPDLKYKHISGWQILYFVVYNIKKNNNILKNVTNRIRPM